MNRRYPYALKTVSALFLSAALAACGDGGSNNTTSSTQPVYTAVFDAGSSGTRLSFFKVTPGNGGYPIIEFIAKYSDKLLDVPNDDGINDFMNNEGVIELTKGDALPPGCNPPAGQTGPKYTGLGPNDVSPCVLQPELKKLDAAIADLNAKTPGLNLTKSQVLVELYATAGMRTEALYNGGTHTQSEIDQFYANMKTYVANWGYNAGQYKTINGNSEEGLWTWINLNDQYFNAFGGNKTYWTGSPTTRGNFEVGGSSMQIAFPTAQLSVADENNVYTVKINGYTYNVYSKTFLGLGGDDMRKFMRSYGYQTGTGYNGGTDCFGTSANDTNNTESSGISLFYNAAFFPNSGTIVTNAVNNQWTPTLSKDAFPLKFNAGTSGLFNSSTCTTKYNGISTAVMALPRNSYGTIPDQAKPASYASFVTAISKSSAPFIGVDGFYHASNALGLVSKTSLISTFTQAQFDAAYANLCNASYQGNTAKGVQTQRSCADATYMKDFLWRTGGLFTSGTGATFEGVAPNDDLSGKETLTWTRGYLLKKYAN